MLKKMLHFIFISVLPIFLLFNGFILKDYNTKTSNDVSKVDEFYFARL